MEGVSPADHIHEPVIEVIRDMDETRALFSRLVKQAKEEVLLVVPTVKEFHRQEKIGFIGSVMEAAGRGVKVSILSPVDASIRQAYLNNIQGSDVQVTESVVENGRIFITPVPSSKPGMGATVLVTDRKSSLVSEDIELSGGEFVGGGGIAVYSTTAPSVKSSISLSERALEAVGLLLKEQAALNREKSSLMQTQLLQDILTHDIRNYVQISKGSAELLREQQSIASPLLDSIIRAADRTGELIEKTKRLARIVTQDIQLRPVDLRSSIERSVELITEANHEKKIRVTYSPASLHDIPGAEVLADELLDEVFTNVLSNSVQYTDDNEVPIEVELEEVTDGSKHENQGPGGAIKNSKFWKVTIADHGRGIHDDMKSKVFTRYQTTASGSGLGLSIVNALVVQRYGGKISIVDRVPGDYSNGIRMEVWLPR